MTDNFEAAVGGPIGICPMTGPDPRNEDVAIEKHGSQAPKPFGAGRH